MIALGANVPAVGSPPAETLALAVQALAQSGFSIRAVSRFYRTPCFPAGAGPDYVNAAVSVVTELSEQGILRRLHAIETDFGRARVERWGARSLDLDLLANGDQIIPNKATFLHWYGLSADLQAKAAPDELILPHPRIQNRAFVLVPLADVAADWMHPVFGLSVRQMLMQVPASDVKEITVI